MARYTKFAERVHLVLDAQDTVLARLHRTKDRLSNQAAGCLRDQNLMKVFKYIERSYPDPPVEFERMQGYAQFVEEAEHICQDLEGEYNSFVDALDFKNLALELLDDLNKSSIDVKFSKMTVKSTQSQLISGFMDLFVGFCQVQHMLAKVESKKWIASCYALAYMQAKGTAEPSFARLITYFSDFDDAYRRTCEELSSLTTRVGDILMSIKGSYAKGRSSMELRKMKELDVSQYEKVTEFVDTEFHQELANMERYALWIIFGYMHCPNAIFEHSARGSIDLLRRALTDQFVVPLVRDETMSIFPEFENIATNMKASIDKKKMKDYKTMLSEAASVVVQSGGAFHCEIRAYLVFLLSRAVHAIRDSPGILGPKFPTINVIIRMAGDEILWFLRHFDKIAPKSKAKMKSEHWKQEKHIPELIYNVAELLKLVDKYQDVVRQYFVRFLGGLDMLKIAPMVTALLDENEIDRPVQAILENIVNVLANASGGHDLNAFRLNWKRVLASFSLTPPTSQCVDELVGLVWRMPAVCRRTQYVEKPTNVVGLSSRFADMWWYRSIITEWFKSSRAGRLDQAAGILSYVRVFSYACETVQSGDDDEFEAITQGSVDVAKWLLEMVVLQVIHLLERIRDAFAALDAHMDPIQAAYRLEQIKKAKKKAAELSWPGQESVHSNYKQLETLHMYEKAMGQLCEALESEPAIEVGNTRLYPKQFLHSAIATQLSHYFKRNAITTEKEGGVERPSVLQKKIQVNITMLSQLENYVNIDVSSIVRQVLLMECCERPGAGQEAGQVDQATIHHYSVFYQRMVHGMSRGGKDIDVFYSKQRRSFLAKKSQFPIDMFADITELRALCAIFGPYGVRVIDRDVVKSISIAMGQLKEILRTNEVALREWSQNLHQEEASVESIKKMKDMDKFVQIAVFIGNSLNFRDLLYDALREVVQEKLPFIYDCVRNAHVQYPINAQMTPEFEPIDFLAQDCGLFSQAADPSLKRAINIYKEKFSDEELWALLPFAFAASFTSTTWKHAEFFARIDAISGNLEAMCVERIIAAMLSWNVESPIDWKGRVRGALLDFIKCSSFVLLRMRGREASFKHCDRALPSMMIFMEKFVRDSEYVKASDLEKFLPYTLVRSQYVSEFSRQLQPKDVSAA